MTINWFEGARRITKLCMVIAALVGAYNAYFEFKPPMLEFATKSPRDKWHPSLSSDAVPELAKDPFACAHSESLWDFTIKPGLVRNVSLCFLGNDEGKIVYYSGPEEADRLKKLEVAIDRARSSNELGDVRLLKEEATRVRSTLEQEGLYEWFGTPNEPEVKSYIDMRVAEFAVTPSMLEAIDKDLRHSEREAFFKHTKEMLSTAAYFVGGFWLFSFVIGWIVRGFAGIPRGQDFRPDLATDTTG